MTEGQIAQPYPAPVAPPLAPRLVVSSVREAETMTHTHTLKSPAQLSHYVRESNGAE